MTLHRYFVRRYLRTLFIVFVIFVVLTLMLESLEHLRRYSNAGIELWSVFQLALLVAPTKVYQILPLIVIIASVATFLGLSRSSELVIARASGRSASRFLMAPFLVTLVLGGIIVGVFNPLVAATSQRYEAELTRFEGGGINALALSEDGIWLRQSGITEDMIIKADRSNLDGTTLFNVQMFGVSPDGQVSRRINAQQASLQDGFWELDSATQWSLNTGELTAPRAVSHPSLRIATSLTMNQIRDSFGEPSAIAIWDLPGFIAQLEDTGFSARRHTVWLQMELALPLFLATLALIGAAFTIAPSRLQNTSAMVLTAIILGFALYFVRNFAQLLGESGQLTALLAAWVPPVSAFGLAVALILQQEDG